MALGLLGPVGPALMLSVMVVALSVHWPNVFAQSNGIEVPFLYAGDGDRAGADRIRRVLARRSARPDARCGRPALNWGALALGVLGGLANLGLRRPAAQAPAHA